VAAINAAEYRGRHKCRGMRSAALTAGARFARLGR
jgi:hypothetical protein